LSLWTGLAPSLYVRIACLPKRALERMLVKLTVTNFKRFRQVDVELGRVARLVEIG
jgi:hypothetical protein